ncbi:MAG TPA: DUF4381 family protein [Chthoniobacter sp.]|nr:DUF4381 family protein [Chthoniobacter sp.]
MSAPLFISALFAVLSTPSPTPSSPGAAPSPGATPAPVEIHDIAGPVSIPIPTWMLAAAGVAALILLGLLVWGVVTLIRRPPSRPLESATAIALRRLKQLRTEVDQIAPYDFSVAVSDVLRTFISNAKFQLPATRLTSPEFLATIANSPSFTESDRSQLSQFLEKCDMIKFARMDATSADNIELVESALAFVQGGQA